jgi:hypothetical protein
MKIKDTINQLKIENLTSFIENPDKIIQFKELKQYRIGSTSGNLY